MSVGYLGPQGTFSHEALLASAGANVEAIGFSSVGDVVRAVQDGTVARGFVPIENALEGSVGATLDALADAAPGVVVDGEHVHAIRLVLAARAGTALDQVTTVASHPHALGQARRFLHERLPGVPTVPVSSTADAVLRVVGGDDPGLAAVAPALATRLHGAEVLVAAVEDDPENRTRFWWLARGDVAANASTRPPNRCAIVFRGSGAEEAGWLVGCLAAFGDRGVNLTRIESRPARRGLGTYRFFVDLEGAPGDERVDAALAAVRSACDELVILGAWAA